MRLTCFVVIAALDVLVVRRYRWTNIASLFVLAWTALLFVDVVVNPLHQFAINGATMLTFTVGLVGFAAGALAVPRQWRRTREAPEPAAVNMTLLGAACVGTSLLLLLGTHYFRSKLATASGVSFGALSVQQVRQFTSGSGQGGGVGVLLLALAPLTSGLGILGFVRTRQWRWLVFPVVGFLATAQSPARTSVLALMVSSLAFYLYSRSAGRRDRRRFNRTQVAALVAIVGVAAVIYFQSVGSALGKTQAIDRYMVGNPSRVPHALISPLAYLVVGQHAFSYVKANGITEPPDSKYKSVFLVRRVLGSTPKTVNTEFFFLPLPSNIVSAFGDLYLDFGNLGVAVVLFLVGAVSVIAHQRARDARIEFAWAAAVLVNVLASTEIAFRLFYLDVFVQVVIGVVVFRIIEGRSVRWLRRPRRRRYASTVKKKVPVPELAANWE